MTQPQRHILVVEDTAELRDTIRIVLLDAGYLVSTAADGKAALALLDDGPVPDAIILDVLMPGMDGAEFLMRVREQPRLAGVKIGIMSGIASNLVAKLLKVDVFLAKPFADRDLLQSVRELLRSPA